MIRKYIYMIFVLLMTAFLPISVSAAGEDIGSLQEQIDSLKQDFTKMKSYYEQRIQDLERQVSELKAPGSAATKQEEEEFPATEPASQGQGVPQNSNPDISAIGDFRLSYDQDGDKQFSLSEMELSLQGAVDPYSRADFFAALHEHEGNIEAELEEGYITLLQPPRFLHLSQNTTLKFGKFLAATGKTNRLHPHSLFYADRPLVLTNLFGHHGFAEAGISLSTFIPNPADRYINFEFEVLNKFSEPHEHEHEEEAEEEETAVSQKSFRDWVYLGRLSTFHELNDSSNFEVGLTAASGKNPSSRLRTNIQGLDFTYRWKPLETALYKTFTWQNELFWAQKDAEDTTNKSFGWYSMGHWQFDREWALGVRYDRSEIPNHPNNRDTGYSLFFNFLPTEFSRYTLQYKHVDKNYAEDDDLFLFQINFNIGTHGAHSY